MILQAMIGATIMGDVGVPTPPKILRQLTDTAKFYTHTHSDRQAGRESFELSEIRPD
jgi:hypothetical protein